MLLPTITKKQQDILLLLYRFRFLNRIHIQTLLNHKTFNRINHWLKDLTDKNYIGKIHNTSAKINTTPSIYYLARNGIKYLKTQPSCNKEYIQRLYADNKRSMDFVNRSLFISDIYISLLQKYSNTSGFTFYTQSDFSVDGIVKEIFPHFVYRKMDGKPFYVAEIFTDKMPRYAVRSRITRYLQFFTKGDWIKHEQTPNILFICPSEELEQYIYKKTKKYLDDENVNLPVYVSTEDQLKKYTINADIWKKVEDTE